MNPNSSTPAYLVCHTRQNQSTTRTFFTDDTLLTARKAAYSFVESLFAGRLDAYAQTEETELYLIEMAQPDDPAPTILARILYHPQVDTDGDRYRKENQQRPYELHREFAYYQSHHHPTGFGALSLQLRLKERPDDTEEFVVLLEAAGAVMAAIDTYNGAWMVDFSFQYFEPDELPLPRQLS